MAFKSHFAVFFLALAVGLSQPVRADQDASAIVAAQQSALPIIIGALADYKTFRMSSAQLDAAVTPYCTKTGNRMRKTMIISEYKCKPGSGITDIRIDSREGGDNPLPNYMMSVVLNFAAEDFSVVRSIMEKNWAVLKRVRRITLNGITCLIKRSTKMAIPSSICRVSLTVHQRRFNSHLNRDPKPDQLHPGLYVLKQSRNVSFIRFCGMD